MPTRVLDWLERHSIWMLAASLVLFFVLLGYILVTKGGDIQAACQSANEVRQEIRGLRETFRQRVIETPGLNLDQVQARIHDYMSY